MQPGTGLAAAGVGVLVAVKVRVRVGVGLFGMGIIWIAAILALSALAGPSWMTIWPPAPGWMLLKTLSSALLAPTSAKISRFVRTWLPLIEMLKTRWPSAVQKISANFRVTW